MPVIRFHLKGAPDEVMQSRHVLKEDVQVLQLLVEHGECTARQLRHLALGTWGESFMLVSTMRRTLASLCKRKLVWEKYPEGAEADQIDKVTYTLALDRLEVKPDKRAE